MTNSHFNQSISNTFSKSSSSSDNFSILFVLDLTSSLRFEGRREIMKQSVIIPILQQYACNNFDNLSVTFAGLTGSIPLGLFCTVLKTFQTKTLSKTPSFSEFLNEIDRFLSKEIDKIIDFGLTGDSLTGNFGIGGTVESICTSLCHFNETSFPENCKKHLILLPTSLGTEILPHFRTCTDDNYASASLPHLLSILRARKISLSLVAPGLSDSTVVEQFIVFKCNEKIGNATKLTEALGSDWVVRLSAGLTGEESTTTSSNSTTSPSPSPSLAVPVTVPLQSQVQVQSQSQAQVQAQVPISASTNTLNVTATTPTASNPLKPIDENELLNQTLMKLSTMPPEERVIALKTLLDPTTSTFSSSFRQKFAAAVKSRLQSQESSSIQAVQPILPAQQPRTNSISFGQRRASQDSSTNFWSGCIRFQEKQQSFLFRVQFVAVDSQAPLPRASLENWPQELSLTGLLDSKKESIQSGLSVGYAFRVNVASADTAVASYLMTRMCQGPPAAPTSKSSTPSHLACFRISQDVLIMLRVLSHEDLQFIGYLIDRRFPKSNLTPAAQAASNAINSLTSMKSPMSTTLSTGMDGLSLGRRPSFDVKITKQQAQVQTQAQVQAQTQVQTVQVSILPPSIHQNRPPQITQSQSQQSQQQKVPATITTNYMSYPQFMQQQQRSPAKIPALSTTTVTTNQLLTDPEAILQKLRPAAVQRMEPIPPPLPQTNQQEQVVGDDQELVQSFVDAWLN